MNKYSEASITGERKNYEITLYPSTVKAGELLTVRLPPLRNDVCVVPSSVMIAFHFKVNGTKATCVNNLSKAVVKKFSVKYGGKELYENTDEDTFTLYRDLWQTNDERQRQRASGIMPDVLRKKISNDDTYVANATVEGLHKIFGNTVRIQLGQILENCGLFAPCALREEFEFEIRLAANEEILVGTEIGTYELTNLRLEYEVIENKEIVDGLVHLYDGEHTLMFEDVMFYRRKTWVANSTLQNIHINPTRQSLRAIVCLFKTDTASTENFEYPNIERVTITSDGVPGAVYNHGIPKDKLFVEAKRFFGEKGVIESSFFLGSQFALVIDLRTTSDKNLLGNGKTMSKKKESQISIEIKKKATTNDVTCSVYLVSDGFAQFEGANLESIIK